jgi:hypothetical protein
VSEQPLIPLLPLLPFQRIPRRDLPHLELHCPEH